MSGGRWVVWMVLLLAQIIKCVCGVMGTLVYLKERDITMIVVGVEIE